MSHYLVGFRAEGLHATGSSSYASRIICTSTFIGRLRSSFDLYFFSCWILYDVYIVILFLCCRVDLWLAGCCRCWPSVGQAARPWPVCEPKGKVLDFCLLIYNTFFFLIYFVPPPFGLQVDPFYKIRTFTSRSDIPIFIYGNAPRR